MRAGQSWFPRLSQGYESLQQVAAREADDTLMRLDTKQGCAFVRCVIG
jgi:hypothetical protein